MKTYRTPGLPSSATVASAVTALVCVWFVAAGGAMLTDQHSGQTIQNARAPAVHVSAVETPTGMIVTATRSSATL